MRKPITIFGTITSPYVNRVVLACRAKRLPYRLTMPAGGAKSPELLAINPLGKIPTIKDGHQVLFESGVILEYFEDKYPAPRLIPSSTAGAARVRLIAAVAENYVVTMLVRLFVQASRAAPDLAIVEDTRKKLDHGLDVLNQLACPGPVAFGRSFTLADCYLVSTLVFLERVGVMMGGVDLMGARKTLRRYWAAIRKNPHVKATLADIAAAG
ncbi:MAG: glutathione S-transferase family protein [Alphaproteobacteria bacterium]|nr:glutathione S-transferase family protein [Alphaproteobacteria bacterium]